MLIRIAAHLGIFCRGFHKQSQLSKSQPTTRTPLRFLATAPPGFSWLGASSVLLLRQFYCCSQREGKPRAEVRSKQELHGRQATAHRRVAGSSLRSLLAWRIIIRLRTYARHQASAAQRQLSSLLLWSLVVRRSQFVSLVVLSFLLETGLSST